MIEGIAIGLFVAAAVVITVNTLLAVKISNYEKLDRGE